METARPLVIVLYTTAVGDGPSIYSAEKETSSDKQRKCIFIWAVAAFVSLGITKGYAPYDGTYPNGSTYFSWKPLFPLP